MDQATSGAVGFDDARGFLDVAYRSRAAGKTTDHPLAVAGLLREDGQPPALVTAGLLHDVLEDTNVGAQELRDRFGPEVTKIVVALTEDPSISDYSERKAALRRQVLDAGASAATVALADKAAKIAVLSSRPKDSRLQHYRATLDEIEERYGRSPLSERLRCELERLPPSR